MNFQNKTLAELESELSTLSSDWMDAQGSKTIQQIKRLVTSIPDTMTQQWVADALNDNIDNLDVFRLFLGYSQDETANLLNLSAGSTKTYSGYKSLCAKSNEGRAMVAYALVQLDLINIIEQEIHKQWTIIDVLTERYRFQRGRAIKGIKRGHGLEDEIENLLKRCNVSYIRGGNFTGKNKKMAKADFSVPSLGEPKIIIESKGFETTGSKLTDVLGDVEKILLAKSGPMYFFLVTDGMAWKNRMSDLKKLVEHHHNGGIDMIYTRKTFGDLETAVRHIMTYEI